MVNISTQNVLAEHNDFAKVMHCRVPVTCRAFAGPV